MRKFEKISKKNFKLILGVIIGIIGGFLVTTLIVNADTILFASGSVSYSNTTSGLTSTTVQGAIDELYTRYNALECKSGYVKDNETSDSYECVIPPIICRAATSLHTETCSQSSNYCYGDGYYSGGSKGTTTITYGSLWDGDVDHLAAGNAFDCDVTGDGNYNERFYYVSDYYNTQNKSFDTNTGVLIYYKNFANGAPNDGGASYTLKADAQAAGSTSTNNNQNWWGPVTAVKHLPVIGTETNQWRDDLLKVTDTTNNTKYRAILAEDGSTHNSTTTSGGTLPTAFEYKNTTSNIANAARLVTAQEIMRGCNLTQVGSNTTGELSGCNFLFERTRYSYQESTWTTYGPWLETPRASLSDGVWTNRARYRYVSAGNVVDAIYGVRPTIDVPKDKLQ